MHYHMEIILPPVTDIAGAIEQIMAPFREGNESDDAASFKFLDWYKLGGRYSGRKREHKASKEQLTAFYEEVKRRKFTVDGFQWGKQELNPASQSADVDALWREMCPGAGDICPIFKHAGEDLTDGDICTLGNMPQGLSAHAVIIAGPRFEEPGLEAEYMIHGNMWNGVNHVDTKWDKSVASAVNEYKSKLASYKTDYAEKRMPSEDWLVVTVDYHS